MTTPEPDGGRTDGQPAEPLVHHLHCGSCLTVLPQIANRFAGQAKLVFLDPPYNTRRKRGARRHFGDSHANWREVVGPAVAQAFALLNSAGFLAVSINQTELFNLKPLIDETFGAERFVGLFPIKIRHHQRQLMINATFHDVFEYLLIYRRDRSTRFQTVRQPPRLEQFKHQVTTGAAPEERQIHGKRVEIYRPGQYAIAAAPSGTLGLRRYVIAGKLATANWSGEWYEAHLRPLGDDLLIRVWGLERAGLGYRWFQTGNQRRRSGVYFQSIATAGRPVLPTNDIDFTEIVPSTYREGGPDCDFKDSKKPEALLRLLMEMCTRCGDLVMDFFAGSGTTLAVGIKTGRPVVAIENDETAVRVIRSRLANLAAGRDLDGVRHDFELRVHT